MKQLLLSMIFITAGVSLRAEETVMGSASYSNKTFTSSLTVMGPLKGTQLTAPSLNIYGPANLSNSHIGSATIQGPLDSLNTEFTGKITVYGNIQADTSTFKKSLMVYGKDIEVVLQDSETKDITIESDDPKNVSVKNIAKNTTNKQFPIIHLKGTTHVVGDITFAGKEGAVMIDDTARHTGKVYGARKEQPAQSFEDTERGNS